MANFSDRDLIEAIYDVRDRVTRIEEKLNNTEGLSDKVEEAEDKANEALLKVSQLEKQVEKFGTNTKWALGVAFGFIATIAGVVLEKLFL
jgi:chromosome segregation ATPase